MDAAALRAQFPVLREKAYLNAGTCGPLAGGGGAGGERRRCAPPPTRAASTPRFERLLELRAAAARGVRGAPATRGRRTSR